MLDGQGRSQAIAFRVDIDDLIATTVTSVGTTARTRVGESSEATMRSAAPLQGALMPLC